MTEHTKEPWHSGCRQVEDDNGVLIAYLSAWKGDAESKANARRIVACVNACTGIQTEFLEMGESEWVKALSERNKIKQQRDELVKALKIVKARAIEQRGLDFNLTSDEWLQVNSALAKVGAGKTAYDPVKAFMDIPPIEGGL